MKTTSVLWQVSFTCRCVLQMADKSQTGSLEGDEFVLFYKMLTQREDVVRIFQDYSGDGQKLTLRDLEDFLREEQLETEAVQQRALELIERYEPSDTGTNHSRTAHEYQSEPHSTRVPIRTRSQRTFWELWHSHYFRL